MAKKSKAFRMGDYGIGDLLQYKSNCNPFRQTQTGRFYCNHHWMVTGDLGNSHNFKIVH